MKFLAFLCCMIMTFGASAQKGAFGEDIKTEEEQIEEKIVKVTGETARRINPNSTVKSNERVAPTKGKRVVPMVTKVYSVLLFEAENPIDITHKAMKMYSKKLFYRQISEGNYFYMVGEFKSQEDARNFLATVKADFPEAEVVNDIDHPHIKL